jgi:hypothetical protein
MHHATGGWIDHSGDSDTNACARSNLLVVSEQLFDTPGDVLYQDAEVFVCLKTGDSAQLVSHEIRDDDIGSRSTNIDPDNTSLARVDVEKRWPATSTNSFTKGPFEDQSLIEEFADEQTSHATSNVHQAGKVSARDRLMSTNEVQSNLSIDFTTSTATRHLKVMRVYLSHSYIVSF